MKKRFQGIGLVSLGLTLIGFILSVFEPIRPFAALIFLFGVIGVLTWILEIILTLLFKFLKLNPEAPLELRMSVLEELFPRKPTSFSENEDEMSWRAIKNLKKIAVDLKIEMPDHCSENEIIQKIHKSDAELRTRVFLYLMVVKRPNGKGKREIKGADSPILAGFAKLLATDQQFLDSLERVFYPIDFEGIEYSRSFAYTRAAYLLRPYLEGAQPNERLGSAWNPEAFDNVAKLKRRRQRKKKNQDVLGGILVLAFIVWLMA